jgi:hypothetical protein
VREGSLTEKRTIKWKQKKKKKKKVQNFHSGEALDLNRYS